MYLWAQRVLIWQFAQPLPLNTGAPGRLADILGISGVVNLQVNLLAHEQTWMKGNLSYELVGKFLSKSSIAF